MPHEQMDRRQRRAVYGFSSHADRKSRLRGRKEDSMIQANSGLRFVLLSGFTCLVLLGACRQNKPWLQMSTSGRAGPNDEYHFSVAVVQSRDGTIQPSPILLHKHDVTCPVETVWKDGRWSLVRSDTNSVEHRDTAILVFEGPGPTVVRDCRELGGAER